MKKSISIIILALLTHPIFAQLSNEINAYFPDGKKINFKFSRIQDILDSLGIKEGQSYSNKFGLVYFKKLSNIPVFILFVQKEYPLKIKEIIHSYNYSKYLNSYSYYYDLKDMIKEGKLTKDYLQDVFKEPIVKGLNQDSSEFWLYKNYNVKIFFNGQVANDVEVMNYKAIEKNELAISSFEVTGRDYTIGFNITLSNFCKKTIKYAFITVTATNPVDDKVGTKTLKAVGPIKPTESGSYEFSDIIYSNTAKYLTIDNIKLQYMDGSLKIVPKSEVQNIKIEDWEEFGRRKIEN